VNSTNYKGPAMQTYATCCYFLSYRSKQSPQHFIVQGFMKSDDYWNNNRHILGKGNRVMTVWKGLQLKQQT